MVDARATAAELDDLRIALTAAQTKETELRVLCRELLESARLANITSDGHRDAHMAYQRWAAVHAPDAIGDEQKREAIDGKIAGQALKNSGSVLDEMLASLEAKAVEMPDVAIPASLIQALCDPRRGED